MKNETEYRASWNFAPDFYNIVKEIIIQMSNAYAENDVRELLKWTVWLFDNTQVLLTDAETQEFNQELEKIQEEIYQTPAGDHIKSLYIDNEEEIQQNIQQMKKIRKVFRKLTRKLQKRGAWIPTEIITNPNLAAIDIKNY